MSKCHDCELDYNCDMNIQDVLWEIIDPSEHKDCGLLCPNCICKRLMNIRGMTCVDVTVDTANACESMVGLSPKTRNETIGETKARLRKRGEALAIEYDENSLRNALTIALFRRDPEENTAILSAL